MIIACPRCDRRHDVAGRPPGTVARCQCGLRLDYPDIDASAGALNCPNCGGSVSPREADCGFCGSHLAKVRCPGCFAMVFDDAKHCHACGIVIDLPARVARLDGDATLHCPRCDSGLIANLVGDTVLDDCLNCGGLWLNRRAFDEIVDDRKKNRGLVKAVAGLPTAPAPRPANYTNVQGDSFYVNCPECERLMDRRQFAKVSGVVLDTCAEHGVWCDEGELTRIIEFIEDGGLERSARHEAKQRDRQARSRPTPLPLPGDYFSLPWSAEVLFALAAALAALILD